MLVGRLSATISGSEEIETNGHWGYEDYIFYFKCTNVHGDSVIFTPDTKGPHFTLCGDVFEFDLVGHDLWKGISFAHYYKEVGTYDVNFHISAKSNYSKSGPWTLRFETIKKDSTEVEPDDHEKEDEEWNMRFTSLEISLKDLLTWDGV